MEHVSRARRDQNDFSVVKRALEEKSSSSSSGERLKSQEQCVREALQAERYIHEPSIEIPSKKIIVNTGFHP